MYRYSFHIQFADGSNPYYHFSCGYGKHYRAMRSWAKNYKLQKLNVTEYYPNDKCVWLMAYPKN